MNKYKELKVKLKKSLLVVFKNCGMFASFFKFMFIIHRRQESLTPSWRGGGGRMLPKIIGTCHTEGMGTVHDNVKAIPKEMGTVHDDVKAEG